MRRIHLVLAALVVVAAVALAACGSSSSNSSSSKSGSSSGNTGNFCGVVKQVRNDKSLGGSINTLADAKKKVPVAKTAIDKLTAAAPSQIKPDMQTIQRIFSELNGAVKSSKTAQDLRSKTQAFASQTNAGNAATKKVDAYAKQHCGTTISGG